MLKFHIKINPSKNSAGTDILAIARKISQFSEEDIRCIDELWQESIESTTDPERYHFLIAENDEKVVGFACYGHRPLTQGTYDFYWLGVDPDFQHHGIGHSLMRAVEENIQSLGGYLIILETSTLKDFSFAREAYKTYSYQPVGEIPDFYKPGDGLVIYIKRLS